jgi:hypothetical protein
MSNYLSWHDQTSRLSMASSGAKLQSGNEIRVCTLPDGSMVLLKIISPDVVYIPRLKILGEVAYSLFDYHLNPAERVTPNVCPVSTNTLWRQFIQGIPGEIWRGKIYQAKGNLDTADLQIVNRVLNDRFAQRIALLDFIFLCQDRSARNWIVDDRERFWAVDNGIFWAYKGRYADKETLKTGKVNHLNHPAEALVSRASEFTFQIGIFSTLHAGLPINDGLLAWLYQIDWERYFRELNQVVGVVGYPQHIASDWRFVTLMMRANWLLNNRRFPTADEIYGDEWKEMIDQPEGLMEIWEIEWEM